MSEYRVMDIEAQIKNLEKLEKKKKWADASKRATLIAEYYTRQQDYSEALMFYERALNSEKKTKNAGAVIVLYRNLIRFSRKGRKKTQKQLFRYAAAAIPIVEEYLKVLEEKGKYLTPHGAQIHYFLGECREIATGVGQRNKEFLQAGQIFIKVGEMLASQTKTMQKSVEAFEKARAIFEIVQSKEDIFQSYLIEAKINVDIGTEDSLKRGFYLFEQAKAIFDDDDHLGKVVSVEKDVYATLGLNILRTQFASEEKRDLAEMLLVKSKEAYFTARSLSEFTEILLEKAHIYQRNQDSETAFQLYDEIIQNAQLVGDEATPRKIIEELYNRGKQLTDQMVKNASRYNFTEIEDLPPLMFFNKAEEICKKLDMGSEAEEIALFIWKTGMELLEKGVIYDDSPFLEKVVAILISHSRISGIHKIGDDIEQRILELARGRELDKMESLRGFLTQSYNEIGDPRSTGWLNTKVAEIYSEMLNHEKQISLLEEAYAAFSQTDQESMKGFSSAVNDQFNAVESDVFKRELRELLGRVYLYINDEDSYDSLYALQALDYIQRGNVTEGYNLHKLNISFLIQTNRISRALKRLEEISSVLLAGGQIQFGVEVLTQQTNILIESQTAQDLVLETIKDYEELIVSLTDNTSRNLEFITALMGNISRLYQYLGLIEAQGDALFELAVKLMDKNEEDIALNLLMSSYKHFAREGVIEKCGMVLDYINDKKEESLSSDDFNLTDKYLKFLVAALTELDQFSEASKLTVTRAKNRISSEPDEAFSLFEEAKVLLQRENESDEVRFQIFQEFGSALLTHGLIERGLSVLEEIQVAGGMNSLAIADTCLNVAEERFEAQDFDTHFILIDRALSLYSDLEMFKDASSIALAEARKLWTVGNLPYTIIYLERSFAPLAAIYDEKLGETIKPILRATEEFVTDLFNQEKFDEVLGFIEFQERIYNQLNWTDEIVEVERLKINAHIGKGNLEMAISKINDLAALGERGTSVSKVLTLIEEIFPTFAKQIPSESSGILEKYIKICLETIGEGENRVFKLIDMYHKMVLQTLSIGDQQLIKQQLNLFFNALKNVKGTENLSVNFIARFCQETVPIELTAIFLDQLGENLHYVKSLPSSHLSKIIRQICVLLEEEITYSRDNNIKSLFIINELIPNLLEKDRGAIRNIILNIAKKARGNSQVSEYIVETMINTAQKTGDNIFLLYILYEKIQAELMKQEYPIAFDRFDNVVSILKDIKEPRALARKYVELLDQVLLDLTRQKRQKWVDLLTTKRQTLVKQFLEKDEASFAKFTDQEMPESLTDDMVEFSEGKFRKQGGD
ncbi:MAG: hypothetical protein ACFFE8_16300 [Candidatus Heimdallarchaeota archaeon]